MEPDKLHAIVEIFYIYLHFLQVVENISARVNKKVFDKKFEISASKGMLYVSAVPTTSSCCPEMSIRLCEK